jgi:oligopeptide transport system substrate-binding protein
MLSSTIPIMQRLPAASGGRPADTNRKSLIVGRLTMIQAFARLKTAALAGAVVLGAAFSAQAETVLHRGNGAEPETIDPHKSTGVPEANIIYEYLEGLVTYAENGDIAPGVATNWEISDDGLTYTFHLREDAKWSNGDPVTAEDFVYSFRRAVDPKTASDYAPIMGVIKNAEDIIAGKVAPDQLGAEAIDPHTFKVSLNGPTPYFIGLVRHHIAYPVHRATVEKFGDQWTRPGNAVGNGAYTISEWTPQSSLTLVKNPTFHDAANVKIDKIVFYPTEDLAEELKRFRAGELDVTYDIPSDQIKWAEKNMPKEFHNTPYFGTYYYVVNLTKEPLGKDLRLREALALAIDRETLTDKITQGGELPGYNWVPPGVPGYTPQYVDWKDLPQAEKNKKAKELLKEAGYGPDKPLELELLYNTSENHKKIAVAVAAMWKQVLGIKVNLVNQEWKVYLETRDQKQFQVARAGWIGDYVDPTNFLDLFLSNAGERNDAGYNSATYDDLQKKAAQTSDLAARAKLLEEAERTFLHDLPLIPIYTYTTQHMISQKVEGWQDNILDFHLARYMSIKG